MKKVKIIVLSVLIASAAFCSGAINTHGIFTNKAAGQANDFKAGTLQVSLNNSSQTVCLDYEKFGAGDSVSKGFCIKNSGSLPFISKISISNKSNPIFDYLLCQVNIYYKEDTASGKTECKYTLYDGSLVEFAKAANSIKYQKDSKQPAISEIMPGKSLKCEIILTLPEDVILPDNVVRFTETKESINKGNMQSMKIKIDATQVNDTKHQ